ncbi:aldo/keto reductase [Aurantiacibacter xanthus]|jgi:aryl-alcohol dehydrogenase-like predicted oxidoreductase|uniref:Aldo/keto reductase n=1 Tax=Aurantiacibacter xanthus TaxID=1784712 RepID=A0A3A1P2E8_9SPHN|nr:MULTISPECIES: aldo/keto reductase [Sphingomonadales]RIV83765.1 aldo/keto reductase [Aurantiacibacter xanthus]|tara:strand:- start:11393 stop:12385 length:993 start_codon:yes stop_codon:yes gene_type:complete
MVVKRPLVGRSISPIGLGCMNLSWAYAAPPTQEDSARLLNRALDLGYEHLDTARLYANGGNETLLGEALKGRRAEFFLASKTGLFAEGTKRWVDCSPATIRRSCEESLKALRTDFIDLYYLHRRDFTVPIEEWAGAMGELVREGKIGGYGLSEMSAETLRTAHAVHPVAAVQVEYSLWTRNPEIAMLSASRELGVALVAFSPLGRGVFANGVRDPSTLGEHDIRRGHPRFSAQNWPINLSLAESFNLVAARQGVSPAQLALAWVLSRGEHVHAIPGTSKLEHLGENIGRPGWRPDQAVLDELDGLINQRTVAGPRYPDAMQKTMDSEDFN